MPGFDRSKLKATSGSVIQKQEKDFQRGKGGLDFLSIETGENVVRVFPYHPDGGGESFAEAKSVSFLEVEVPKRDAEKKIVEGQFELKRKPIFNMKVHGNEEQRALKLDLVEAYMQFAKDRAIPDRVGDNKEEFAKLWSKITGNALTKEQGIKPQDSWVVYAKLAAGKDAEGNWSWGKIGLLDLKKSVKDAMTERAAEYEEPDPFTDPDTGIAVIITKAKESSTPAGWYKVKMDKQKVKSDKGPAMEQYVYSPLTDAEIDAWAEMKPLHELYVNSFKYKDFKYQMEGLKRFDEKLGNLVFSYDEFLDTVELISSVVPEEEEKPEEEGQQEQAQPEPKKEEIKKITPAARVTPPAKTTPVVPKTAPKVVEAPKKEEVEVKVEPPAAHIADTNDRLAQIRARMGKK